MSGVSNVDDSDTANMRALWLTIAIDLLSLNSRIKSTDIIKQFHLHVFLISDRSKDTRWLEKLDISMP